MAQSAPKPVPDGMHTITPQLWFNGNCNEALEFYKKAFRAEQTGNVVHAPDGRYIWHAMLKIGDSYIMLADTMPGSWEKGPQRGTTLSLWLYVNNCDDLFNNAVNSGCEVVFPMDDMFWGDRTGKVKDPFGHCWAIASQRWIYTQEEVKEKLDEAIASQKSS